MRALLESLAAQDAAGFEVVVVDDGSTDGTAQVLADPPLPVRTLAGPSRGPAAARNAGWGAARGSLVCFLDDDVVVAPGWLTALAAAHGAAPGAVLQARTEPLPDEAPRQDAFSRSKLITGYDFNYATCNIAYPRELLERLGGFDEAYRFASAEDTDLGWRAREAGASTVFVEGAHAFHAVQRYGVLRLVRRMRIKTDVARLTRRHPGLRHHYHRGIFWKRSHERLLLAVAGTLLARRTRGGSLALALPYAALYRGQHGSWPGTLAALPGHVAVDGAETAAVAAGAARFRTLLV